MPEIRFRRDHAVRAMHGATLPPPQAGRACGRRLTDGACAVDARPHAERAPRVRMKTASLMAATAVLAGTLLSGCVTYHARALPASPDWTAQSHARTPPVTRLTLRSATTRALTGNPAYKASLLQVHVSALQMRQAGLLPDPQFGASLDKPTTPGYSNGWSVGLTQDFSSLLTHGASVRAARARLAQTRLEVLWQGWMLVQKTAADYVALWDAQQRVRLLSTQVKALQTQQKALDAALAHGDTTRQQQGAALTTLSQAQAQLSQARQDRASGQLTLNEDIGLAPQARYALKAPEVTALPDEAVVEQALTRLPERRPDLLALAAAYRAADATFRAAVLAQFPGISVNLNRASDTSRVTTDGFGISLNLPIFGRARDAARIARASRNRMYAAYQARLDGANSQARALYARLSEVQERSRALHRQLKPLRQLAREATRAFRAGNFSAAEWSAVQNNLIAREIEALRTRATLAKGRVALAALLGRAPEAAPSAAHSPRAHRHS